MHLRSLSFRPIILPDYAEVALNSCGTPGGKSNPNICGFPAMFLMSRMRLGFLTQACFCYPFRPALLPNHADAATLLVHGQPECLTRVIA